MATLRLNQVKVDALKPRKCAYDVRDRDLKGFGVRTYPSGAKRYFIHSQHQGQRVWKIVGQAASIDTDEARHRARAMLVSIREGCAEGNAAPPDTPFETVADEVFRRYSRHWKPSTLKVNLSYYKNQILPWFEGRPDRRDRPRRRPAMVCIPPQYSGCGRPLRSHPLGHHAPGRGLRLSAGRDQSL